MPLRRCFNSRPSCEGRPLKDVGIKNARVSIHAPHARGDVRVLAATEKPDVSIHAPHARGDRIVVSSLLPMMFQFTPLMRGATKVIVTGAANLCFNSRPSCEGRPDYGRLDHVEEVSIHAPHARGDGRNRRPPRTGGFNSRPSCEGRRTALRGGVRLHVSIHAPHARGDLECKLDASWPKVSIHAPHARGDTKQERSR